MRGTKRNATDPSLEALNQKGKRLLTELVSYLRKTGMVLNKLGEETGDMPMVRAVLLGMDPSIKISFEDVLTCLVCFKNYDLSESVIRRLSGCQLPHKPKGSKGKEQRKYLYSLVRPVLKVWAKALEDDSSWEFSNIFLENLCKVPPDFQRPEYETLRMRFCQALESRKKRLKGGATGRAAGFTAEDGKAWMKKQVTRVGNKRRKIQRGNSNTSRKASHSPQQSSVCGEPQELMNKSADCVAEAGIPAQPSSVCKEPSGLKKGPAYEPEERIPAPQQQKTQTEVCPLCKVPTAAVHPVSPQKTKPPKYSAIFANTENPEAMTGRDYLDAVDEKKVLYRFQARLREGFLDVIAGETEAKDAGHFAPEKIKVEELRVQYGEGKNDLGYIWTVQNAMSSTIREALLNDGNQQPFMENTTTDRKVRYLRIASENSNDVYLMNNGKMFRASEMSGPERSLVNCVKTFMKCYNDVLQEASGGKRFVVYTSNVVQINYASIEGSAFARHGDGGLLTSHDFKDQDNDLTRVLPHKGQMVVVTYVMCDVAKSTNVIWEDHEGREKARIQSGEDFFHIQFRLQAGTKHHGKEMVSGRAQGLEKAPGRYVYSFRFSLGHSNNAGGEALLKKTLANAGYSVDMAEGDYNCYGVLDAIRDRNSPRRVVVAQHPHNVSGVEKSPSVKPRKRHKLKRSTFKDLPEELAQVPGSDLVRADLVGAARSCLTEGANKILSDPTPLWKSLCSKPFLEEMVRNNVLVEVKVPMGGPKKETEDTYTVRHGRVPAMAVVSGKTNGGRTTNYPVVPPKPGDLVLERTVRSIYGLDNDSDRSKTIWHSNTDRLNAAILPQRYKNEFQKIDQMQRQYKRTGHFEQLPFWFGGSGGNPYEAGRAPPDLTKCHKMSPSGYFEGPQQMTPRNQAMVEATGRDAVIPIFVYPLQKAAPKQDSVLQYLGLFSLDFYIYKKGTKEEYEEAVRKLNDDQNAMNLRFLLEKHFRFHVVPFDVAPPDRLGTTSPCKIVIRADNLSRNMSTTTKERMVTALGASEQCVKKEKMLQEFKEERGWEVLLDDDSNIGEDCLLKKTMTALTCQEGWDVALQVAVGAAARYLRQNIKKHKGEEYATCLESAHYASVGMVVCTTPVLFPIRTLDVGTLLIIKNAALPEGHKFTPFHFRRHRRVELAKNTRIDLLFGNIVARLTGCESALEEYGEHRNETMEPVGRDRPCCVLPRLQDLAHFLEFVESTLATCRSCPGGVDTNMKEWIGTQWKPYAVCRDFGTFKNYLASIAAGLAACFEKMSHADDAKSVKDLLEALLNCGLSDSDQKKTYFYAQNILMDQEQVIENPWGDNKGGVTARAGSGATQGLGVLKLTGDIASVSGKKNRGKKQKLKTDREQQCFEMLFNHLSHTSDEFLTCLGLCKVEGVLHDTLTGAPITLAMMEHIPCNLNICLVRTLPSRTCSDPKAHARHCHPSVQQDHGKLSEAVKSIMQNCIQTYKVMEETGRWPKIPESCRLVGERDLCQPGPSAGEP